MSRLQMHRSGTWQQRLGVQVLCLLALVLLAVPHLDGYGGERFGPAAVAAGTIAGPADAGGRAHLAAGAPELQAIARATEDDPAPLPPRWSVSRPVADFQVAISNSGGFANRQGALAIRCFFACGPPRPSLV